tara:strand:- start:176 stop:586 length:411 start_codon:yes stop_codon:yes gene_type:complete
MNSKFNNSLNELKDIFAIFDDPIDKFSQIIDMGKKSNGLSDKEKSDCNKINGCSSLSWVVTELDSKGNINIKTDSEALIVKGLLSILEFVLNGKQKELIYEIEAQDILENINLNRSLTSQRTNGFISAIDKIREQI